MNNRKLVLKRDVLQSLTDDELVDVVAGTRDTLYSCMDYISCAVTECILTVEGKQTYRQTH